MQLNQKNIYKAIKYVIDNPPPLYIECVHVNEDNIIYLKTYYKCKLCKQYYPITKTTK